MFVSFHDIKMTLILCNFIIVTKLMIFSYRNYVLPLQTGSHKVVIHLFLPGFYYFCESHNIAGNTMKQLFIFTLFICTVSFASGKNKNLNISKERVEVIITETTTEGQLKKIKKTLKEEANIDFNFKGIIVNSKNKISEITVEIDSNDGVKGSGRLIISNIYNVGFIRNYKSQDNGDPREKALFIGNISEKKIKLD